MATYLELRSDVWPSDDLRNKIQVAVVISANSVLEDSANFPTTTADTTLIANREKLAFSVLDETADWADRVWKLLIADNNTFTVNQILNAADATIQTKVDGIWDALAGVWELVNGAA